MTATAKPKIEMVTQTPPADSPPVAVFVAPKKRAAPPTSDRVGMLAHLAEHWAQPGRPATWTTEWAGDDTTDVKVTFTYEREAKGKFVKMRKVAIGTSLDEAAANLASLLSAKEE